MSRSKGVTLVEVVLATGVAAVFLTAFMVQFRVQQASFQVASDELRIPGAGHSMISQLLGFGGFSRMWRPDSSTVAQAVSVEPGLVRMPMDDRSGASNAHRAIRWAPALNDPRPQADRPGGLEVVTRNQPAVLMTAPSAIATMSFYSPELFTPTSNSQVSYDTTISAAAIKTSDGKVAFYVLGASLSTGAIPTPGKMLAQINHSAADGEAWKFFAARGAINGTKLTAVANVVTVPFSRGGVFKLDLGTSGTLICAWPPDFNPASVTNGSIGYTLGTLSTVRRVGFWMKLNTSPYTGLIAIRDSYFLRN